MNSSKGCVRWVAIGGLLTMFLIPGTGNAGGDRHHQGNYTQFGQYAPMGHHGIGNPYSSRRFHGNRHAFRDGYATGYRHGYQQGQWDNYYRYNHHSGYGHHSGWGNSGGYLDQQFGYRGSRLILHW